MINIIKQKLYEKFNITNLEIFNDSHLHQGHAGDDGSGNSHFRINIISDDFKDISRVNRHKMIYQALSEILSGDNKIHALQINVKSKNEAQN